ncbi:MAG: winged helix-turn-helix domain-containing protein [Tannerellaceae bacterium]|nr:winged helix-turn-helix domain-containing protein [Tannerellaceae bacterium]
MVSENPTITKVQLSESIGISVSAISQHYDLCMLLCP